MTDETAVRRVFRLPYLWLRCAALRSFFSADERMHALSVVERARERGADRQGFRARQRRRRRRRRRRRALSACEASRWRLLRSSFILLLHGAVTEFHMSIQL